MSNILFENLFISVGIDVGANFSFMSIALPNQTFVGKPFKILHSDLNSLSMAVSKIKEAEEMYSLESRIFLESTRIYHYPLFCYLRDKGFNISIINPISTKNSTNINIRKVHNDKFDSKKAALIGLKPDLKVSLIQSDLVLDLRNLSREYYDLVDNRSTYINKLQGELRMVFPQYLKIFSKITVNTALTLLEKYTSPDAFLNASKDEIITSIRSTARFGASYAEKKYNAISKAASDAKTFGYSINSNFKHILLYIRFIRQYNDEVEAILSDMQELVDCNEDTNFVKQIHLIESFKGAGFLSAVSLMCEIGDFSAFKSTKQLFAYFGLDPAVNPDLRTVIIYKMD
ncbi:IS110 family transposase [Dethiothermospora halolimnae]|uniref:IS110 family transposase n=1 Tax=Dethiothermospora halolimnae TaxID=3114390 RepID=UPI003CCC05B0